MVSFHVRLSIISRARSRIKSFSYDKDPLPHNKHILKEKERVRKLYSNAKSCKSYSSMPVINHMCNQLPSQSLCHIEIILPDESICARRSCHIGSSLGVVVGQHRHNTQVG